ncbi:hypothetical protein UFOVP699_139 [uncultured Caudovirales phage]|uniref:Peptidase C51 domain-containing protein n=1 Tax=uncultured Caudovirales phage TaxID=2100421 RepID=A0A6J5NKK6_9CAUD|nr:hypothetical protein UFOVP699_139 [uncultured Caudovirales phage]
MKHLKSYNRFINEAIISTRPGDGQLLTSILQKYVGKKEEGNNSGEMVKNFLKSVGLGGGKPWCMAFVKYVFDEFCKAKGIPNPLPVTGGTLNFLREAPAENKIPIEAAKLNPNLVLPGQIFIKGRKGGGHTGIIIKVEGDSFYSIDGNSSDMVKVNKYKIANMLGFVDFFKNPSLSAEFANFANSLMSGGQVSMGGGKED